MLKKYADPLLPYAPVALRVMVGVIFLLMGLPKLQNPSGFIGFVTTLGFPAPSIIGWIPVILEPLGGLLLILGLGTRWVGLYFVVEMAITGLLVKAARGTPFIVASGKTGVGFEFDLLLLAGALALFLLGSGQLSVEKNILKREL